MQSNLKDSAFVPGFRKKLSFMAIMTSTTLPLMHGATDGLHKKSCAHQIKLGPPPDTTIQDAPIHAYQVRMCVIGLSKHSGLAHIRNTPLELLFDDCDDDDRRLQDDDCLHVTTIPALCSEEAEAPAPAPVIPSPPPPGTAPVTAAPSDPSNQGPGSAPEESASAGASEDDQSAGTQQGLPPSTDAPTLVRALPPPTGSEQARATDITGSACAFIVNG